MTSSPSSDGMTDEQLIEAVATEVMGWKDVKHHPEGWSTGIIVTDDKGFTRTSWSPLTDWNHTMEVVEKLENDGWSWNQSYLAGSKDRWCQFFSLMFATEDQDEFRGVSEPRRAICLAALQAVRSS